MPLSSTIALAGNPNAGKSTIFNALTGSRQHVGNWPGKTVEKKEGTWTYQGRNYRVVDLPGTYSLTAFSLEEVIARDFIIHEKPDLVVLVIDSANLERNLYLTVQVLEIGVRAVAALNMSDQAAVRGMNIQKDKLEEVLSIPVVATTASKGHGLEELKAAIAAEIIKNEVVQEQAA
ncbi:MAG: 50S ribosome-binding GTPase [Anaerolineales bacterium]|nr:50S ribosome-binding GTPase [Anaerolineales bacterium]